MDIYFQDQKLEKECSSENLLTNSHDHFQPDFGSPPGDTLLETLEALGMSQTELARRMGRPVKTINEIIQAKTAITPETALQLEQVLRIPASFWLKREQHYQEYLARLAKDQRLSSWTEWLNMFPLREMMRRGWLPPCKSKTQQVFEALKFFGVASPETWEEIWKQQVVKYRKSATTSNFEAVTAWLRQGEILAQEVEVRPYNADAFRTTLQYIRTLTDQPVHRFQPELLRVCAESGVAVVFVPELPHTSICGATRWLTPTKALIQLSLRYKTNDHLWFTFFHEAAHILLHKKRELFLDLGSDPQSDTEAEKQADRFATDLLVDPSAWQQFVARKPSFSKVDIRAFAQKVGIAPGIIVGRLQHEMLLPFSHCNELKQHLEWGPDAVTPDPTQDA